MPLERVPAPGYGLDALLHAIVLFLHSYQRWLVLGLALAVAARSLSGLRSERPWSSSEDRLHAGFVWSMRIQFILGVLLYVLLSPITDAFFSSLRAAMKVGDLRFFGLEHALMMLAAVAVADTGRARSKRIADPRARRRRVCWTTGIPLLLMLAAVPWPFMPTKRPLLRSAPATAQVTTQVAACPPIYQSRCAACHGGSGRGDGVVASGLKPAPRNFSDHAWRGSRTTTELRRVIREGGPALGMSPLMPANSDLSDAELDALANCVSSFAGAQSANGAQ